MSHVKNYDVGQIHPDLLTPNSVTDAPFVQYTHELPLLSFGDIQHSVNLSLVFNYERYRDEKVTGQNPFCIAPGFKLNLQKRLMYTQFGIFTDYQEESGKIVKLNNFYGDYTFDDDSQRIIIQKAQPDQTGNISADNVEMGGDDTVYDYFLEYPDFSKEKYGESGRIMAVYDKYSDNAILTYAYDTSGRLTTITFRNGNAISLAYHASNKLQSITYNNQSSSFFYNSDGTLNYVEHYTGVKYYYALEQADFASSLGYDDLPESDLKVTATATEGSETVSYAKELKLIDNGETIKIIDYIGNNSVKTESYKLPKTLLGDRPPFHYVDTVDQNGVVTRVQFYNGKPMCSYEIQDEEPQFDGETATSRFLGNITMYNTSDDSDDNAAKGVQTRHSGLQLNYNAANFTWSTELTGLIQSEGYYTLTGWIKSNASDVESTTINLANLSEYSLDVDLEPGGQWQFFSIMFRTSPRLLSVFADGGSLVSMRDLRIIFQETEALTDGDQSRTNMAGYLLFNGSSELSFHDARFFYKFNDSHIEITTIDSNGNEKSVTLSDVLRYQIRQMRDGVSGELFYNNCKNMITGATDFEVLFNGSYISLGDLDLGIRVYSSGKESLTKYHLYEATDEDGTTHHYIDKTCTVGTTVVSRETLDSNLDVIESASDGITTTYTRDAQGRVTSECGVGLYRHDTVYTDALVTVTDVNPSSGATISSTKYHIDTTWGAVTKVEMFDSSNKGQSLSINTYDESMSALTAKAFDNMLIRRNSFAYAKGRLASTTGGTLTYNYLYNDTMGELASVTRNGTTLEEHTYRRDNGETTVESHYPTEESALHTENKVFDKYGRLKSVDGVLENQYCIEPQWTYLYDDPDTDVEEVEPRHTMEDYDREKHGELIHSFAEVNNAAVDGKDAMLSQTIDRLAGEVTRYGYSNGMLTAAVTRDLTEYPKRQETFVYDKIGRLKKSRFDHDMTTGDNVTSSIRYYVGENDPFADNRVGDYSYSVNNILKAFTYNFYDDYKRITKKRFNFSGRIFQKQFVYSDNKVSSTFENTGERIYYSYDDLGRISSFSNGQLTKYQYNAYGQLIRENNQALDKTFVYRYNSNGGISTIREYAYATGTPSGTAVETTFTYDGDHPDRLTAFGDTSISYNAMGCPTAYNGYNTAWTRGKLSRLSKGNASSGMHAYTYNYNAFGQRIGSTYTYTPSILYGTVVAMGTLTGYSKVFHYDQSGRLIYESKTSQYYGEGSGTEKIVYLYDESGIIGMLHTTESGTTSSYYFQRNLLGDVIAIYDTAGTKVGGYAYDAWGNCTITLNTNGIATKNPIRYRGYYYDEESGLYYLNARYYSPTWRRFISPDDTAYLDAENPNGLNLYTYCNNDPVNYADPSGHSIVGAILLGATIGAVISGVLSFGSELISNDFNLRKVNPYVILVDAIFGAIDGALSVMGLTAVTSLLIQPVLAGAQTVIGAAVSGELHDLTTAQVVNAVLFSALMIGASSALYRYCKFKTGYNTFENHRIRKFSKNRLETARLPKKIAMYEKMISDTYMEGVKGTLGYVAFTSTSIVVGGGLGL